MLLPVCLAVASFWAATRQEPGTMLTPYSWPCISSCIWLAVVYLKHRITRADQLLALGGLAGSALMLRFLQQDPEFSSWGDVFYFCGSKMQYCNCDFSWNLAGWAKAAVLWVFVLTTAMGLQRLLVQLILQGTLPGEEVVMRDCLICICWRLIPYYLNNWELEWGAECSSMTFELPHFVLELVVVLPCVQILCSRLKVLVMPSVNAALPRRLQAASAEQVRQHFVPNVLRACWERRPEQQKLWCRLRANRRVTIFAATLCLLSAYNALYLPIHLEDIVLAHPKTAAMQVAGRITGAWPDARHLSALSARLHWGTDQLSRSFVTQQALHRVERSLFARYWRLRWAHADLQEALEHTGQWGLVTGFKLPPSSTKPLPAEALHGFGGWMVAVESGPWSHNRTWTVQAVDELKAGLLAYLGEPIGCQDAELYRLHALQHHRHIFKLQDPHHISALPLTEAALSIMRLSTERFFTLLAIYVAFLLFHTPTPAVAALIDATAFISSAFSQLILYSFPLICWTYGAGVVFSTLVSVTFWFGPVCTLYRAVKTHGCTVTISGLRPATAADIERMHHDCAICWCPMAPPGAVRRPLSPASTLSSASSGYLYADSGTDGSDADSEELEARQAAAAAPGPGAADAAGGEAAEAADGGEGVTLSCNHSYHQQCITQWLQQCHSQGTSPTCPMCQSRLALTVKWHVWDALRAPNLWQLPHRALGRQPAPEQAEAADAVPRGGGGGGRVAGQHGNNYLLRHNPALAEQLAALPQLTAPENVQLLADVQELRQQRELLATALRLRMRRRRGAARLEEGGYDVGEGLEQQRQQLLTELQRLTALMQQQVEAQQADLQHGRHGQQPVRPADLL